MRQSKPAENLTPKERLQASLTELHETMKGLDALFQDYLAYMRMADTDVKRLLEAWPKKQETIGQFLVDLDFLPTPHVASLKQAIQDGLTWKQNIVQALDFPEEALTNPDMQKKFDLETARLKEALFKLDHQLRLCLVTLDTDLEWQWQNFRPSE